MGDEGSTGSLNREIDYQQQEVEEHKDKISDGLEEDSKPPAVKTSPAESKASCTSPSSSSETSELKPKPRRKRRPPAVPWKKPKDMPKRPLSAYNLFFKEERERMLKSGRKSASGGDGGSVASERSTPDPSGKSEPHNVDTDDANSSSRKHQKTSGIGFANMAKIIAAKWKNLDLETKAPFEAQASKEKKRYKEQMVDWRAQQASQKERLAAEQEERESIYQNFSHPYAMVASTVPTHPDSQHIPMGRNPGHHYTNDWSNASRCVPPSGMEAYPQHHYGKEDGANIFRYRQQYDAGGVPMNLSRAHREARFQKGMIYKFGVPYRRYSDSEYLGNTVAKRQPPASSQEEEHAAKIRRQDEARVVEGEEEDQWRYMLKCNSDPSADMSDRQEEASTGSFSRNRYTSGEEYQATQAHQSLENVDLYSRFASPVEESRGVVVGHSRASAWDRRPMGANFAGNPYQSNMIHNYNNIQQQHLQQHRGSDSNLQMIIHNDTLHVHSDSRQAFPEPPVTTYNRRRSPHHDDTFQHQASHHQQVSQNEPPPPTGPTGPVGPVGPVGPAGSQRSSQPGSTTSVREQMTNETKGSRPGGTSQYGREGTSGTIGSNLDDDTVKYITNLRFE